MDGGAGNWRRNIAQSTEVREGSHRCHLGPVSSLEWRFWHLKRGEEGADGRQTTALGVVIELLDGRMVKTRGQRVHARDPSRKASPSCLPERGELEGDRQVSKPWARGCRHLGPRRWSRCDWMDALGRLSSSLSRAGIQSLRGGGRPPCEEPGPFLACKLLQAWHHRVTQPATRKSLPEGREGRTGTDPECQQWG